jgi:hypothetical protein
MIDKDKKQDLLTIKKGLEYTSNKCKLENESIYESIIIKKEICYGKIYIDVDDAFTKSDTGIPYKYMF